MRSYMNQFLGVQYGRNQDIVERVGHYLVTESDFKNFMSLIVDVYESGFMRAVDDYRTKLAKMGIKVEVENSVGSQKENSQQ